MKGCIFSIAAVLVFLYDFPLVLIKQFCKLQYSLAGIYIPWHQKRET